MTQRGRLYGCPVEFALDALGGNWKTVIIARIKQGPLRYSELRRMIPSLSDKMLTQRLKDLEESGLVRRRKSGGRGAPSSYELTARAQSLRPALESLNDWGMRMAGEFDARVVPGWVNQ